MKTELSEKVIEEIEKCWISVGAENFDSGIQQLAKLLAFMQRIFESMKTREQLREFLDQLPEPSWLEKQFIFRGFRYLPQVIRYGLKRASQIADETLPNIPRGRPGLDLQLRSEIVGFVGKQHMKGYSLELAKKSAAKKFSVSEATVQRTWDDRGSLGEIDFRTVVKYLADGPAAE